MDEEFGFFVAQQVHREDPVGDIASELMMDACLGDSDVVQHVESHGASTEALDALAALIAEYEEVKRDGSSAND